MQNNNNKNNYETIVQNSNSSSKSKVKRNFEYIAANYENYIKNNKLNKYGSKMIKLPNPEFYVIMTKNIKNQD